MTMKSGLPTGMIRKRLEFVYDYLGRRVEKKVLNSWTDPTGTQTTGSGTTVTHLRYVYDGHNLIAELNGSNNTVLSTYVWGLDLSGTVWGAEGVGGLLMVREGSKTYFPAYDGNGNVSALLDSADGSLDAKYEYGAFGETLRVSGTAIADDNPFRFSTKYTDTESGLVYYGFRYYSPSLGRFLNRDPLGEAGGSNLYGFVENDPVNGWDYLGLTDWMGGTCADYEAVFGFSCLSLSPLGSTSTPKDICLIHFSIPLNTSLSSSRIWKSESRSSLCKRSAQPMKQSKETSRTGLNGGL